MASPSAFAPFIPALQAVQSKMLFQQRPAALLVCLLAAAAAARAQDGGVPLTCQSAVWSSLPLAAALPADQYDPISRTYYSEAVLPNALPAFVFACIAAALLLALVVWRAVRTCACTACLRGPRLRGKAAADLLSARRMRWLRWGIAALAAGAVAGAGFGFSTIQPALVPSGIGVYEQAKAYVAACLQQANSTAGAVEEIGGHVTFLRQRVIDLGLDQQQPGVLQIIDSFRSDIASAASGIQSATADVQRSVLDRMEEVQAEWQPQLDKIDVGKNAALYAAYVLIIAASLALALGVALSCPALASGSLGLLLAMVVLAWAAVSASTVGLQVGSNGCSAVEQKITDALVAAAKRQITTGEGVLALVGVGDTLSLARYYFYGQGKNATEVVSDLTGLNIPRLLAGANQTVSGLQQAAAVLKGANSSASTLPDNLDALAASLQQLSANFSQLEGALSYESFNPEYMAVKQYVCCDALNWVGGIWLGLLVVGCCGLPLSLAVFWWLARMDKLAPRGCCHMHRSSDYASKLEAGHAAPGLPDKKRQRRRRLSWDSCSSAGSGGTAGGTASDTDSDFLARLSPEQHMTSLSLRQKFQTAGLLRGGPSWAAGMAAGAGAAAAAHATAPPGSDTFRIGTATYPTTPASQQAPEQQQQELVPASPATAPPLTADGLSARSLGSARRPRQCGTWAAAASAPAPPAAAAVGSRSAPGSALNSARSASGVQLLPAVEALSPKAQAELPGLSLGGAAKEESPSPLVQAASSSGTGGSALRRAGSALARLKLLSRRNA
ncbi:hypothetical protein ABPG75_004522 [Micractinium tetrahymenae]